MRKWPYVFVYAPLVALADLILIHLSFMLVLYPRLMRFGMAAPQLGPYVHVMPYISVGSLWILYVCNLYVAWLRRKTKDVVYSIMVGAVGITVFTMALELWERQFLLPRSAIVAAGVMQFVFLTMYRVLLQKWFVSGIGRQRVMVISPDEETAVRTICKLQESAPEWMSLRGYVLADELERLEDETSEFDSVLLTASMPEQRTIIKRCSRLRKHVMVIPAVLELSLFGSHSLELDDVLILAIERPHLAPGARLVKRCIDLSVSTVVLVLTSPVLAAAAVAIRLSSKGPAIFKQKRVGQDGEEYTLYKFRTMVADAEKHTGPVLASESDERITPLGRWLRATRLDESPQLFNVLKGDMSLVGPRPERAFFVDDFRETVPGYDLRFSVKPGITGLAQVAGGYSTTVERKLRFDLMYIFDYSLLMDIQILFRTVLVMIDKTQAEGIAEEVRPAEFVRDNKS